MRVRLQTLFSVALLLSMVVLPAMAQDSAGQSESDLVQRGKYIATAGDCAACHQDTSKNGSAFGGGIPIGSPMGAIYASNITPDKEHGIGAWTFEQFRDAMREGKSPTKGRLYPAMPYTAYAGMSDDDIRALYTYLMKGVAPSPHEPPKTQLAFPFIRPAMLAWDTMFLHPGTHKDATAPAGSVERGRYVAEALEHCSTCHTPRNALLAEDSSKLLSGAQIGNWYAPNITPDSTGIGSWTDDELAAFLTKGHNTHAVAGGDMGTAVERSLSRLQPDDVRAVVAYLRSVPAISTPGAAGQAQNVAPADIATIEPQQRNEFATLADASGVNGAQLYESACASCHAVTGGGSVDGKHPDLASNAAVLMTLPDNLVMTIADGVHRNIDGHAYAMPGFAQDLTNAQIGALATYVRQSIGGLKSEAITGGDVARIRHGDLHESWLIAHAAVLAVLGALVLLIVIVVLILLIRRRSSRRHPLAR